MGGNCDVYMARDFAINQETLWKSSLTVKPPSSCITILEETSAYNSLIMKEGTLQLALAPDTGNGDNRKSTDHTNSNVA